MVGRILCLSIRQPWAWAILHAGKDVENRDWTTRVRGRVLVHASKGCTRDEWTDAAYSIARIANELAVPELKALDRGGIVGSIDIVNCVEDSASPWFVGKYGFVLANPRPLPFTTCKGQLGFFECPPDALESLRQWKQKGGGK